MILRVRVVFSTENHPLSRASRALRASQNQQFSSRNEELANLPEYDIIYITVICQLDTGGEW
ncbi:MAG: hypothetical protein UT75_C0008G0054 [Candidatus Yanofskybacteria bacterium GW2011_GWE2_40_11]|uniref:Uncharacterized protein n=1 Tax=Candidatus Yanofskybacteria bacterium GW2011_GWE2_40_11 TaxID=1619033 RepID=A0A0G0TRN9_9BACT|nr:MAG: hypothetical protein UT75_C0008G0054 [Candidatus Yanofskybacteria bacterium GW2011_GWE2_40_11]